MKKEYTYEEIWEHQSIIVYIANYRFSTLQYLKNQYELNNPATYSRFIRESMYAFRETVIIDLCKLFIKPSPNEDIERMYKGFNSQLNFYYNIHKYKNDIEEEKFNSISKTLEDNQEKVNYLLTVRDKEIGHKDLSHSDRHKFHLNDLSILSELLEIAKQIILTHSYRHDFDEYSEDYTQPKWAIDVLDAINFQRNETESMKFINNLKSDNN